MTSAPRGIASSIVDVVARALVELGATPRTYDAVGGYVPGPVADALINAAADELGDPAIGLTVARHLVPGILGPIDYALLTAATWGEALQRAAQFYAVVSDRVAMSLEPHGDEVHAVQRRISLDMNNRHWIEVTFGVLTQRGRQLIGSEFRLRGVTFVHPAPSTTVRHQEVFAAPVLFEQTVDRLIFDKALLDAPLRTRVATLAETVESQLSELVPAAMDPAMIRVRAALVRAIDDATATLDAVARQLGVSPRSLQRLLQDHGSSFKQLLDELRRDRALALLREGKHTVAEVGAKVGFADVTGFIRAFRRWTGKTPGQAS
ncbi:MAG: AraC family transcriptional regulator [Kofleriaceae bacterium]